jgi:hypothetical protein
VELGYLYVFGWVRAGSGCQGEEGLHSTAAWHMLISFMKHAFHG